MFSSLKSMTIYNAIIIDDYAQQGGRIVQWQTACPRTKKSAVQASAMASCCGGVTPAVHISIMLLRPGKWERNAQQKQQTNVLICLLFSVSSTIFTLVIILLNLAAPINNKDTCYSLCDRVVRGFLPCYNSFMSLSVESLHRIPL